ncbi:hypothetical protein [Bradyrhizobium sp. AZCC 2289]|uniref:hypothetical protein n=1 Tax=Bradyrhizobium sp. AZCC 2289 TaxID=3117026 RepID=UPI002FF1937D
MDAKGDDMAASSEHGFTARALVLGATDRRVRAVVSQVPTISGFEQGLRRVSPDAISALETAFSEDDRAQLRGETKIIGDTRKAVSQDVWRHI